MNNSTYKPSNKFSVVGIILMFFSMLAAGLIMSWLYLILNAFIPIIYLNILLALGVSFGLGAIGGVFVKLYKLRAPTVVMIVSLVALIFVNYAKWAIYVGRDYDKYIYDDMKDTQLTEFYDGLMGTEVPLPTTKEDADKFLMSIQIAKSVDIKASVSEAMKLAGDNSDAAKALSSVTMLTNVLGNSYGDMLENIFGSTSDEILESVKKLKSAGSMTMYDFLYNYRGMQARTGIWLMVHPGELFSDIKNINSVGRWTITSHRWGLGDAQGDNVHGFVLWVVWIAELAFLMIPALLLIKSKAEYPFIEFEDDWAVEEKPMPQFHFDDMTGQGVNYAMVKSNILRDPEYIFSMPIITITQATPDKHYVLTYCRSRYFDENYITVKYSQMINPRKNQRKETVLVKNLKVDASFIATLYGMFKLPVPAMCQGENRAEEVKKENDERDSNIRAGRPQAPARPKATGAEAIFDVPLNPRQHSQAKEAETSFAEQQLQQEQSSGRPTSGDMDGIDTSALNLDDIDLNHM